MPQDLAEPSEGGNQKNAAAGRRNEPEPNACHPERREGSLKARAGPEGIPRSLRSLGMTALRVAAASRFPLPALPRPRVAATPLPKGARSPFPLSPFPFPPSPQLRPHPSARSRPGPRQVVQAATPATSTFAAMIGRAPITTP